MTPTPNQQTLTQAPNPNVATQTNTQSEMSKIMGILYVVGITAAAIFVKNPNHVQTASNILTMLNTELPTIQNL